MLLPKISEESTIIFANWKVTAYFENHSIKLNINPLDGLESFSEMQRKRIEISPEIIREKLVNQGFILANVGICVALELVSPYGDRFAVFTRRGVDKKCLALISGYWNAYDDTNLASCAKRELVEEFLVYDHIHNQFLVANNDEFPYKNLSWRYTDDLILYAEHQSYEWVKGAKVHGYGDDCRIYIDATTSSAQIVFGYCIEFRNWDNLSIYHAEDHPDNFGKMVTYIEDNCMVFFQIKNQQLVGSPYILKSGKLHQFELSDDSYFHTSMVAGDEYGIINSNKIYVKDAVKSS